ncbi:Methyltransferase type 11 (fragment) [Candidatus Sulfopaludibacter sp. SbA3]
MRIAPEELTAFARDNDLQLLALEQIWTQYMWMTCRKRGAPRAAPGPAGIRNISNALTGEAVAPAAGPMAAVSVWVQNLPVDCDLIGTRIAADGLPCRLTYIGEPEADGVSQVNAFLPEGLRTGLVPVELQWHGVVICPPAWVRIMPAGPAVPRIYTVADGVNLLSGNRIVSGSVKVTMIEVTHPEEFRATVDGIDAQEIDSFCADPIGQRYEFNFRLPESIRSGPHQVRIALGHRALAPLPIEVA